MNIPEHVCRGKRSNADKSSAILKFVLLNLAARYTSRASIRSLAEEVGMDHSTICLYMRNGSFSNTAANRIIETFPDTGLRADNLVQPLTLLSKSPG